MADAEGCPFHQRVEPKVQDGRMTLRTRISLRNISKRFGRQLVLSDASLEICSGEIHAILGDNGAGKTTFAKILVGLLRPDSGEVLVDGRPTHFRCPADAWKFGIGMVFQVPSVVASMTLEENLALGDRRHFWIKDRTKTAITCLDSAKLEASGQDLEPSLDARVDSLTFAEQHVLEIQRLIARGTDVFLLDEPTASLGPGESRKLFEILRSLCAQGKTILLITHRLSDVLEFSDRVSILRSGRFIATYDRSTLDLNRLRELLGESPLDSPPSRNLLPHAPLLEVRSLTVHAPVSREPLVSNLSFSVHKGEILGLTGFTGMGLKQIVDVLTGGDEYEGRLLFEGQRYEFSGKRREIGYLPENPLEDGVAGHLPAFVNLLLGCFDHPHFCRRGFLQTEPMKAEALRKMRQFKVDPLDPEIISERLSGGNLKKLVMARELSQQPTLIFAVNPTAGLDIHTRAFVSELLRQAARGGAAILVISTDADELAVLSDRTVFLESSKGAKHD
jgi:ABC-type uncharacterized transport system ATPase subunit